MSESLTNERKVRQFNVIEEFNRVFLAIVVIYHLTISTSNTSAGAAYRATYQTKDLNMNNVSGYSSHLLLV